MAQFAIGPADASGGTIDAFGAWAFGHGDEVMAAQERAEELSVRPRTMHR
ncbi:hypothetical protein [Nonomuraea longicatena]|uniref:Uncharacterized protein n=1 Tax=Nonomuraea longicatena TaxID=83682 RepID=A0ABN1Q3U1_9ACTN